MIYPFVKTFWLQRMMIGLVYFFLFHYLTGQEIYPLYDGVPEGSESWTWEEAVDTANLFNAEIVYNVTRPTVTAYLPPYYLATGTAVIIAPGGAFHILSMEDEGRKVAEWLNTMGVAAFVLKYRLAHSLTNNPVQELMTKMTDFNQLDEANAPIVPLAMMDALTAMEFVRNRADEFDIKPDKIGIMGFSAGGTLAMSAAYNANEQNRPNFVAPVYAYEPAIIGSEIPKEKTPIFITVAGDDQLQMVPCSMNIYRKWFEAGQPAELHIYEKGGHGFGMREQGLPTDSWYERFGDWLKLQGYLQKLYPNKYEKLYGQDAVEKGKVERIKQMQIDYANLARYREENKALAEPVPGEQRVVFLGNSITEGWVNTDPAFFKDNDYIGRGISGQTSMQLLLRFRQDVVDLKPNLVVIHIGTNDVAENTGTYDADFTMHNIQSMVEIARANNIRVILASVLPATKFEWNRALGDRSGMIVALNTRLEDLSTKQGIPFVNYHSAMKNASNGMDPNVAQDGVHPSEYGFWLMKKLITPVIQRELARK